MTWQQADSQRRQFGRRETNTRATAVIPGHATLTCDLKNVSEGGALVIFENSAIPTRPFRLTVDGAGLTLLCEVRHSSAQGVGVRFLNPKDGALLMQHLYPEPLAALSSWAPEAETGLITTISNRDLRDGLSAARIEAYFAKPPQPRPTPKRGIHDSVRAAMLATSLKFAAVDAATTRLNAKATKAQPPYYSAG